MIDVFKCECCGDITILYPWTCHQAIWSVLMRNFDMELMDPFPEADYQSMVVGPKSCRIRYRRRKL